MAGYQDMESFRQGMSSTSVLVPCMKKVFGVSYCPHCDEAANLFDRARSGGGETLEQQARKKYFKKQYYGFGIVNLAGTPQHGQVCLVHFTTRVFEEIMDKVSHTDERLRWPAPDNLASGHQLLIQKYKKDAQYNDYKVSLDPQPAPLDPAWFASVQGTIPDIKNSVGVLDAYYNWPAANKFIPVHDMQVGQLAGIRVLPPSSGANVVPFTLLHFHYVDALGRWDTAWRECRWDVNKENEIMAQCGYGGSSPSSPQGGSPYANAAPGPQGVAAPGLGALTGDAPSTPGMYGGGPASW